MDAFGNQLRNAPDDVKGAWAELKKKCSKDDPKREEMWQLIRDTKNCNYDACRMFYSYNFIERKGTLRANIIL